MTQVTNPEAVLSFWFEQLTPEQWYKKDFALDRAIEQRFGSSLERARKNELFAWRDTSTGRLAEIILLDQFSRNCFRGQAQAFAQDTQALTLAMEAVRVGADQEFIPVKRAFFYLPYMHSESLVIHEVALNLFSQPGLGDNHEYELKHKAIIEKFGRYPHRNEALGRVSSESELEFIRSTPGF